MLPNHLVIFAKAPRFGTVKTRLAADIGKTAALRFYRSNLFGLARRLGGDPRWMTWLAVTPDDAVRQGGWPDLPRIRQGRGDLGDRMQRVMDLMPAGPVCIIGSDIPGIRPIHIASAFDTLGANDAVLGPTPDGGYWLVGLKRRPRVPQIFQAVEWSSGREFDQTRANITGPLALIETRNDVDTGADL
ncbi:MAG: TIGR04282 family arsenosugar biosynthesis glycosyltransferase [Alphaproteobacteria bacterium]